MQEAKAVYKLANKNGVVCGYRISIVVYVCMQYKYLLETDPRETHK